MFISTVNPVITTVNIRSNTFFDHVYLLFQMSMLQLLTGLLDQHGDTAQQAALLAYLRQGEEAQPHLEVNTGL